MQVFFPLFVKDFLEWKMEVLVAHRKNYFIYFFPYADAAASFGTSPSTDEYPAAVLRSVRGFGSGNITDTD